MPKRFGLFSSARYRAIPNTAEGIAQLDAWLYAYGLLGIKERVIGVFAMPTNLIGTVDSNGVVTQTQTNQSPVVVRLECPRPTEFKTGVGPQTAYTPKNKKLFTFPYVFGRVTLGSQKSDYVYEKSGSQTGKLLFDISGVFSSSPKVQIIPVTYDHVAYNNLCAITESFPQLPSASTSFISLLGTDGVMNKLLPLAIAAAFPATTGIAAETGAASTAIIPYEASALSGANNSLGVNIQKVLDDRQNRVAQVTYEDVRNWAFEIPNILGSVKTDNFRYLSADPECLLATGHKKIRAYAMTIRKEDAIRIDTFFSMYGYATERVKVPNRDVRDKWCFTKTKNCAILGNVPADAADKICKIYNKGIRFWKHDAPVGVYGDFTNPITAVG